MSTHKRIDRICIAVILLSLAVTILFMQGERFGIAAAADADAEESYASAYFSANDLKGDWDTSGATVITLNGDSAKINGSGAYWMNGSLTIVQSGRYVISGGLTDGNIVIGAEDYSKVWILLNSVTVHCSGDACIRVNQADKVFLTLAEATENVLTGAEAYGADSGVDAVLFSHDDLTINGSGSLTVSASCGSGIDSKDDLIITGGAISVTAPDHGIEANDRLRVTTASLTIDAGGDGIHSDGEFLMRDGSIMIAAGDDGIHAGSLIRIDGGSLRITDCYEGLEAAVIEQYGGDVTVQARDDALNANGYTGFAIGDMWDRESGSSTEEKTIVTADETYVLIAGGTLTVTNVTGMDADGIDSNGNITITGGTIRIFMENNNGNSPLDCGTEAGGKAVITGGTVIASGNCSMAEGFHSTSGQCSVLYNISEGVGAGAAVSLTDADGKTLLSGTIPCGFSSVILSCPEMTVGSSCQLTIGDIVEEIMLSEVSAVCGDAAGQAFGGTMGPGGMRPMQGGAEGTPPARPDGEDFGKRPGFPNSGQDVAESSSGESAQFPGADAMPPEHPGFPGTEQQNGFPAAPEQIENGPASDESEPVAETDPEDSGWLLTAVSSLLLAAGILLAVFCGRSRNIEA